MVLQPILKKANALLTQSRKWVNEMFTCPLGRLMNQSSGKVNGHPNLSLW